jgi:cyclase
VRSAEQARRIIGLGVEKVSISAAALADPPLVTRIADQIGRQSVVVVLDAKKRLLARDPEVWTHNGSRNTKRTVLDVAVQMESLGAGEIVVNSIDHDGQMKGYDLALAARVREALHVPMTVLGGAGSLADIGRLVGTCGVIGAAAGSLFVFKGAYRAVLINYPNAAQKEDLMRNALHPKAAAG